MDKNLDWEESRVVSALTLGIRQPENAKVFLRYTKTQQQKCKESLKSNGA